MTPRSIGRSIGRLIGRPIRMAGTLALAIGVSLPVAVAGADTMQLEVVSVSQTYPKVNVVVSPPPQLTNRALPASAWRLEQGGKSRTVSVQQVSNDHLEVVLVIDTSGSMRGAPMIAAKAAAISFVRQMPLGSSVALVSFGDQPTVVSPLTSDVGAVSAAIEALTPSGETALNDAVVMSTQLFSGTPDARHSVVVLSDGGDTASIASADAAITALQGADATGYVASLVTSETDAGALQRIAEATGGRVAAAEGAAIQDVFAGIAATLTNQYQLTFRAVGTGQTTLSLRLEADGVSAAANRAIKLAPAPPNQAPAANSEPPEVVRPGNHAWMPIAGLVTVGVALLIVGLLLFTPRRQQLLAHQSTLNLRAPPQASLHNITDRATQLAERSLERRGGYDKLNANLEQAGIALRPGEFLVLATACAFVAFAAGVLFLGAVGGLLLALLTLIGFQAALKLKAERRRTQFAAQLGDTLQLLSGSLRSGYGLLQAVDGVAREADAPTGEEFGRLVIETRLGRSVPEALHAMSDRIGNEDFDWVVQAIDINREVGGDLTELLDKVGETIRERDRVRRQIRALSAEGRLSAVILMAIPILLFGYMWMTNPSYIEELTGSFVGNVLLVFAVGLLVAGGLWLRKIVQVVF